jgi:hypothetical protein
MTTLNIEEIEKLTEEIINGKQEEMPDFDVIDLQTFVKFLGAMAIYMVTIRNFMEIIDKRLVGIELMLADDVDLGKA